MKFENLHSLEVWIVKLNYRWCYRILCKYFWNSFLKKGTLLGRVSMPFCISWICNNAFIIILALYDLLSPTLFYKILVYLFCSVADNMHNRKHCSFLYLMLLRYDSELSTPTSRVMFLVSEIHSYLDVWDGKIFGQ